jgi:bacillithiol biosynthesis cysteine-adding enzyme BshC
MTDTIPIGELFPGKNIFADCWKGTESFQALVPRHFSETKAFQTQARLIGNGSYDRKGLATVLLEQNRRFSAGPLAMENIERLTDPRSVVVIGGQQAGLFGGPLYTIYKALTVLALSEHLRSALKRPVVPVFWIASEDSDLAEVSHALFTDAAGKLSEIKLEGGSVGKVPVSQISFGSGIIEALSTLRDGLPADVGAPQLMAALTSAYAPDSTYPRAFGMWMQHCLREKGIVMVDPADTKMKSIAKGLFKREIAEQGPVTRAVLRQTERIRAAGYPAQLELREGMLTLFSQHPVRDAILVTQKGFQLKSSGREFTQAELLSMLDESPERFTPNAALRPLYQDTLFPTIAVVLGPSELAYYAQLTEAYEEIGIPMPVLFPRASLTLIEPKIGKLLDTHSLSFEQIVFHKDKILDVLARKEIPSSLLQGLSEGRAQVEEMWRGLAEKAGSFEPTLRPTAENTSRAIAHRFQRMEKKVVRAARRKNDVLRDQVQRILSSLYPRGGLQERSLTLPPFIARYGTGLIDIMYGRIDPFAAEHRCVRLP